MRIIIAIGLALPLGACQDTTAFPTSPTTITPITLSAGEPLGPGPYALQGVSLSGVVYELTPAGRRPIAAASVYCELCGEQTHTWATADDNGFYHFSGDLASGGGVWLARCPTACPTILQVGHEGFEGRWTEVLIDGDTTFDIELVRS